MKQLLTLIGFVSLCHIAIAHPPGKSIDLGVTLKVPAATGASIQSGVPFNIDAVVINNGPDSLQTTDQINYAFPTHSGGAYVIDGQVRLSITGRTLRMGDTMHITRSITINYAFPADSLLRFCIVAFATAPPPVTVADMNANDDTSCAMVTFHLHTSGVENITSSGRELEVTQYPNPVKDAASFSLDLIQPGDVFTQVFDITGRAVLTQDNGVLSPGTHTFSLNTQILPNGLYMYRVTNGNDVTTGKFSVSR